MSITAETRRESEEIMFGMGFSEPNQVRPRLTELKALGLVKATEKRRSRRTGKNTAVWEAVSNGES